MKTKLMIVQSANDCEKINLFMDGCTDFLVFTPDVMLRLDYHDIPYRTIEDFYKSEKYITDVYLFNDSVEKLLYKLDFLCNSHVNFPHAYSGNAVYFFTWLDDLLYLDNLIKRIKEKYDCFYVYNESIPKKISWNGLSYSELVSNPINGTVSFPSERSIERSISIIFDTLDAKFILDKSSFFSQSKLLAKIKYTFERYKSYVTRVSEVISSFKVLNKSKCTRTISIIQDGYEVALVKKYLSGCEYIYPILALREKLNNAPIDEVEFNLIEKSLSGFTTEQFSFLQKYVELIFKSYNKEIVSRIDFFNKSINSNILKTKPSALLFSMGIRDVFDMIIANAANNINIPVIFFQHGGCLLFQVPYLQQYTEHNLNIKKILIINSKSELDSAQHPGSEVLAMGSILRYNMERSNLIKPTKDVLYCTQPYECAIFRRLTNNSSCVRLHKYGQRVLSIVQKQPLFMDIKIHPIGRYNAYYYYKKLIRNIGCKNVNVVMGQPAEQIFKKYRVIILDFIGTALFTNFCVYNLPIILFIRDFDTLSISDEVKCDLTNRCYIVKNSLELQTILEKYVREGLPSKWDKEFLDKYIYPVNSGNPGINISDYIHSL